VSLKRGACLKLSQRAKDPTRRQDLASMAETWEKLAAELDSEQALLNALSELEFGEPFYAVPEALNLQAVTEGVQGTCSRQTNSPGSEPGLSKRPSDVLRGNAVRAAR
jgi:hypothetical protein